MTAPKLRYAAAISEAFRTRGDRAPPIGSTSPPAHSRPHVLFSLRKPQLHGGLRTAPADKPVPRPLPTQSPQPNSARGLENYIRWLDASFGTPPHASRSPHRSILISGLAARFLSHHSNLERCRIHTHTPLSPKLDGPVIPAASRDWPATCAGHARRDAMAGNPSARPARSRAGPTNAAIRTVSCSPLPHCQCCHHHPLDVWLSADPAQEFGRH